MKQGGERWAHWEEVQTSIESSWKGLRLHHWICYRKKKFSFSEENPPSILFFVHGFGEHSHRYRPFLDHFLSFQAIDAIASFDHLGHGRSDGQRGHCESMDQYVQDLELALDQVENFFLDHSALSDPHQKNKIPIYLHLCGHSLGGLILFLFLLREKKRSHQVYASASLSAPFFGFKVHTPWLQTKLARLISSVAGRLSFHSTIDPHLLSHDLEVVRLYQKDPLVHDRVSAQFFTCLEQKVLELMRETNFSISVPLQFLIPVEDHVADSKSAEQIYSLLSCAVKKRLSYPGLYHEIFNEVGQERPIQDLKDWIQTHRR